MPGKRETTPETIELRERVVKLRLAGFSFRDIARALGRSNTHVHRLWRQELAEREAHLSPIVEEARRITFARYEAMMKAVWTRAMLSLAAGSTPDYEAIDRVLRVMSAECRMFGIDAPSKSDITVQAAENVGRMMAELAVEFIPPDRIQEYVAAMRQRVAIGIRMPEGCSKAPAPAQPRGPDQTESSAT